MHVSGDVTEAAVRDLQDLTQLIVGLALRVTLADESRLSLTQFRTVDALHRFGPAKHRVLAKMVGMHASTMSRTCRHLEDMGLVSQRTSPASAREVIVRLTAKGKRVQTKAAARRAVALSEILRQVPASQQEQVAVALRTLSTAASVAYDDEAAVD
jgi:DNA-binding MarR family transcriptional regulator